MIYPQCPDCRGFSVRTVEWVRWTDSGPKVVSFGDPPTVGDWCCDCEATVTAEWFDPSETNTARPER